MTLYSESGFKFVLDDGGREQAGYVGWVGDCVCRAIAIATETPYQIVYAAINEAAKSEHRGKRKRGISSARNGVYKNTIHKYLESLGWQWTPTMHIGSGCRVHLKLGEIPGDRTIVSLSKHLCAIVDYTIHDLTDPSRNGTRCVYGYWSEQS